MGQQLEHGKLKAKDIVEYFDDEKLEKLKRYKHLNKFAMKGQI